MVTEIKKGVKISVSSKEFITALESHKAIPDRDSQSLKFVRFIVEGNAVTITSTDGKRLLQHTLTIYTNTPVVRRVYFVDVVYIGPFLTANKRSALAYPDLSIRLDDGQLSFGDKVLLPSVDDVVYPETERCIPKRDRAYTQYDVVLPTFTKAVERIGAFADNGNYKSVITLKRKEPNEVCLASVKEDGHAYIYVKLNKQEKTGKKFEMSLDPDFLLDGLRVWKNAYCQNIIVAVKDSASPIVLQSVNKKDATVYVCMPVGI